MIKTLNCLIVGKFITVGTMTAYFREEEEKQRCHGLGKCMTKAKF